MQHTETTKNRFYYCTLLNTKVWNGSGFFCFVSHNQLCYDIHHNGTLLMGSINCENLNRLLQQPTKDSFITLIFFSAWNWNRSALITLNELNQSNSCFLLECIFLNLLVELLKWHHYYLWTKFATLLFSSIFQIR